MTLLLAQACVEARERETADVCVAWSDDIASILAIDCVGCHQGAHAEGSYALDAYSGVLGRGTDGVPNAIAGDATSRLLTILAPDSVDDVHRPVAARYDVLRRWVVACDLAYRASLIHEKGLMNPSDPDFHGQLLRDRAYDFEFCAKCHGIDAPGGKSGVSCLTCHPSGPKDCETCHSTAEVLAQGAHAAHLSPGALGYAFACTTCHEVPVTFDAPGHVVAVDGTLDPPPAEVVMSAFASLSLDDVERSPPTYDASTKTCANVYCHGDRLPADTNAEGRRPRWDGGSDQASCGRCHGLPPSNHAIDACELCHQETVSSGLVIHDLEAHLNGRVEVGDESSGCSGCHGSASSPAPPPSLFGETRTSTTPVGAHAVHLSPRQGLRGPMACEDCHLVPDTTLSLGHIDSPLPAEVFPVESWSGRLAAADDAQPAFDHETRRCSDVYCHGGGTTLSQDTSVDVNRTPLWTRVGRQEVVCGSCHGLPPTLWPHNPNMAISDCVLCHASVVDEYGNIRFEGAPNASVSEHIDGEIDR
ncbi:MAG: CxxxxCH/CxxCH domain-containing protein [Deltaproteobacteria bacterium]|nr:CxxxxCH/CxxCH domain-containing protein [Deltaproteobacteria bacterium]